jgi:hypothetical protein
MRRSYVFEDVPGNSVALPKLLLGPRREEPRAPSRYAIPKN